MSRIPSIPAPKSGWHRFWTNPALYDMVVAFVALVTAGGAFYLAHEEVDKSKRVVGYLVFVAAALGFAATAAKVIIQWKEHSDKQSTHELDGCLFTLHDIIIASLDAAGAEKAGFRITVHVPKGDGQNLVQVVNYVGNQRKPNKMGQLTPIACGITGRAFRTKNGVRLQRADDNYEVYLKELMENQGYTQERAEQLDRSTMSGYAFPITNNQTVIGVVYADSMEADFFTEERINTIKNGCVGIARFVGQKYKV